MRWAFVHRQEGTIAEIAGALKAAPDETPQRVTQVLEQLRALRKRAGPGQEANWRVRPAAIWPSQAKTINGVLVLAAKLDGADAKALRDTVDQLKNKLGSAVVFCWRRSTATR